MKNGLEVPLISTFVFIFSFSLVIVIILVYYFFAIIGMEVFLNENLKNCCKYVVALSCHLINGAGQGCI